MPSDAANYRNTLSRKRSALDNYLERISNRRFIRVENRGTSLDKHIIERDISRERLISVG